MQGLYLPQVLSVVQGDAAGPVHLDEILVTRQCLHNHASTVPSFAVWARLVFETHSSAGDQGWQLASVWSQYVHLLGEPEP